MERTPIAKKTGHSSKIKRNSFKRFRTCDDERISDEVTPVSNKSDMILKTPTISMAFDKTAGSSSPITDTSPQFKVGWNDGFQKKVSDISPIGIIPRKRRIRKCPEGLSLEKLETKRMSSSISDNEYPTENSSIEKCIDWANSLMDDVIESPKRAAESLDDSANEALLLYSQAIEEQLLKVKEANPSTETNQHTPYNVRKRRKLSDDVCRSVQSNDPCEVIRESDSNSGSNSNSDLNKLSSSLEDDNEWFSSLDFTFLDSLQNRNAQSVDRQRSVKLDDTAKKVVPTVKYNKAQIEQRRMEAKKKLLSKRFKSM